MRMPVQQQSRFISHFPSAVPHPQLHRRRLDPTNWESVGILRIQLHSRKLTWKPKKGPVKTTVLLQGDYMGLHVSLGECIGTAGNVPEQCMVLATCFPKGPMPVLILRIRSPLAVLTILRRSGKLITISWLEACARARYVLRINCTSDLGGHGSLGPEACTV